jgi:Holliday junction resolvasome RuvABC endonuclease subunit
MKICKIGWGIASKEDITKNVEELIKFADHAAEDSTRKEEGNITIYK